MKFLNNQTTKFSQKNPAKFINQNDFEKKHTLPPFPKIEQIPILSEIITIVKEVTDKICNAKSNRYERNKALLELELKLASPKELIETLDELVANNSAKKRVSTKIRKNDFVQIISKGGKFSDFYDYTGKYQLANIDKDSKNNISLTLKFGLSPAEKNTNFVFIKNNAGDYEYKPTNAEKSIIIPKTLFDKLFKPQK